MNCRSIRIEDKEIVALIRDGVLRRDLAEGEEAAAASAKIAKLYKSAAVPVIKPKPLPKPEQAPDPQPAPDPAPSPASDAPQLP